LHVQKNGSGAAPPEANRRRRTTVAREALAKWAKNMTLSSLKSDLQRFTDPIRAKHSLRFFKTGKGEYGERDKFLGLTLPQIHVIAKKYKDLSLADLQKLLHSPYHEHRLTALLILVRQFKKNKSYKVYKIYMNNTRWINNWYLVDLSAPHIVGGYLLNKPRKGLYKLAKSKLLWDRRIAVLATLMFIRNDDFKDCLQIAKILLGDKEDLIHKAVGWMLREVGKKEVKVLEKFLEKNISQMPRTCLRYAIEKLPEGKRKYYLHKKD
jgi:3-methyladenine DNA glycosylase AlkD